MEYTFKIFLKNQNIKLSIVSISIVMYFDLNFFIFFFPFKFDFYINFYPFSFNYFFLLLFF